MARLLSTTNQTNTIPGSRLFGGTSQSKTDLTATAGLEQRAVDVGLGDRVESIKKTKSEDPKQIFSGGFISDVFDTLNLLQHGVTGTLQGKGFIDGVKTRASFSEKDQLGQFGFPGVVAGIAADIAVDPLTYAGGLGLLKRGVTAAGKGAKVVGKIATKVPAAEKTGNAVGRMFIYRFGQDPVYKELAERSIRNSAIGVQNMMEIVRPLTKLDQESQRVISEARKLGQLDNLKPELLAKAKPAFDELDRLGKEAVEQGLLPKEVFDQNVGKYIARLYKTKEIPEGVIDKVKTAFGAKPKRIELSRFKKRTDIPEEVREAMGEILEAGYPTAKSLVQLTQAVENAKFFNTVSAKWGSDVIQEGMKKLPDTKSLGRLAGKAVPEPIFDDIQEIIKVKSPTEKALNKVVSGFKYGKVILNPATHARNIMSNFVLNNFEGLSPARLDIYAKAAKSVATKDELYKEARQAGLGLDTFASQELRDILVNEGGSKIKMVANKIADMYQKEEEFAKMAQYIYQRGRGLNPEQAYEIAERATFNYAQVTPFIRKVRESVFGMPFVTFTYKVTPQVARTVATKPTKISNIGKIKTAIENQSDLKELTAERANEPSWMRNGFFIKLPMKDSKGRSAYLDLTYILPFGDLLSGQFLQRGVSRETGLPESIPEAMLSKSPLLGTIKELAKNQDFFGNRIWKESDTTEKQLGDIMRHLTKTYMPPLVADQIPGGYRADGKRRPSQIQKVLQKEKGSDFARTQDRTLAQEMLKQVGLKIQPFDLETQARYKDREMKDALTTLLKESGQIAEFTRPFIPKEERSDRLGGRLF